MEYCSKIPGLNGPEATGLVLTSSLFPPFLGISSGFPCFPSSSPFNCPFNSATLILLPTETFKHSSERKLWSQDLWFRFSTYSRSSNDWLCIHSLLQSAGNYVDLAEIRCCWWVYPRRSFFENPSKQSLLSFVWSDFDLLIPFNFFSGRLECWLYLCGNVGRKTSFPRKGSWVAGSDQKMKEWKKKCWSSIFDDSSPF